MSNRKMYEATPISEPPKENGVYVCIRKDGKKEICNYSVEIGFFDATDSTTFYPVRQDYFTHYLREVPPPDVEKTAVEFAEWLINNNMSPNGFGGWTGRVNTNYYGSKSSDLYTLFTESKNKKP